MSDTIDHWLCYVVFGLFCALIIVTTAQVICREFFTALSWSEEATRYLLVWSTFFTATLAYKRGKHIAITFAVDRFSHKIKKVIIIMGYLFSTIFFLTVIFFSIQMIQLQAFQLSPALWIPMKNVYIAIPISFGVMVLHAVSCIFDEVDQLSGKVGSK